MQEFTNKYRDQIDGTLSGFDRLVFRGSLRRLNYGYWDREFQSLVAQGMEQYLWQNHVLFEDYLDHVKRVSQKVKQASVKPFESPGLPVEFLRDPSADKDEMARAIATKRRLESGLVCALSSVELGPSFEHRGTHLVRRVKPCQVLYQPGLKYRQQGNCFVWIEDYGQAQKLMNQQWEINWAELPNGFAGQLNPLHENIFEQYPASYYWTAYQSEWATDIVFREADFLKRLMPLLVLTTASTTVHQLNQLPKAA